MASCTSSTDSSSSIQPSETWTAEEEPLVGSFGNIAVDEDGNVFACDTENHAILKYDSTGTFVTQTGREGAGPGEFRDLNDLEVFGDTVYVVDKTNRRINLFTTNLKYIRQVGFPRKAPDLKQIAFDDQGNLYGAGTGMEEDDWLLHDVLQADSSRFIELKHVHGNVVYDQFKITTSRPNDLLAVSYALKDTLELLRFPDKPIDEFSIIRDYSHEPPPPVTKGVATLKSRPLPDADDFITWDMSSDERGNVWILAGNYAKPTRQVLYVYNTEGERISKTKAPSKIYEFTIREGALYAVTENSTELIKYKISYP
jgi:hypothetical protein